MEVSDLDPGAVVQRSTTADKFRMTAIQIGRDSACVAWERGYVNGGEFVALYSGSVHINDLPEVLDDQGQQVEPEHLDFSRFMQLAEVQALVLPMSNFTKSNAHDSEAWLAALRALFDSRGL